MDDVHLDVAADVADEIPRSAPRAEPEEAFLAELGQRVRHMRAVRSNVAQGAVTGFGPFGALHRAA